MMDGIHDLGGMEGFGPVPVTFSQNEFTEFEVWEKRMTGLSYTLPVPGMTIDWFRHVVERMVPSDYLSFAYFNKWCAAYMAMLIDDDVLSLEDLAMPPRECTAGKPSRMAVQAVLDEDRSWDFSYRMEATAEPRLLVGQTIRTHAHMHSAHTRLPRYARGVRGTVVAHHGCHPLPDQSAKGIQVGEHLYTVTFDAVELWGDDANPRDTVAMELWESYLVPA